MAAKPQNHHRRVITSFMLRFIREAEEIPAEGPIQGPAQGPVQTPVQIPGQAATQPPVPPQSPVLPVPPEIPPVENDPAGRAASNWRGVVKHIQSGAEQHFSSLAEAENFIKKYIED